MELRTEEGRGRYYAASRDLPRGTVVLDEVAVLAVVNRAYAGIVCATCIDRLAAVKPSPDDNDGGEEGGGGDRVRCDCGHATFCNEACKAAVYGGRDALSSSAPSDEGAEADERWDFGRNPLAVACAASRAWNEAIPMEEQATALGQSSRAFWVLATMVALSGDPLVTGLEDHQQSVKDLLNRRAGPPHRLRHWSALLEALTDAVEPIESQALLFAAACTVACNAICLTSSTVDANRYAIAIAPRVAMFNHACGGPGLCAWTHLGGGRVRVATLDDTEASTPVSISYLDPSRGLAARRSILRSNYFFDCTCERCESDEADEAGRDSGTEESAGHISGANDPAALLEGLIAAEAAARQGRHLDALSAMGTSVFAGQPPWICLRGALLRAACFEAVGSLGRARTELETAVRLGEDRYPSPWWPQLGHLHARLGRLLMDLAAANATKAVVLLDEAADHLQSAASIYAVACGSESGSESGGTGSGIDESVGRKNAADPQSAAVERLLREIHSVRETLV